MPTYLNRYELLCCINQGARHREAAKRLAVAIQVFDFIKVHAILFGSQAAEAFLKCNVLNKMTSLEMPDSYLVLL